MANRAQRRAAGTSGNRVVLQRIVLTFEDGTTTMLDPLKVDIVDFETRKPIFERAIEGDTDGKRPS